MRTVKVVMDKGVNEKIQQWLRKERIHKETVNPINLQGSSTNSAGMEKHF